MTHNLDPVESPLHPGRPAVHPDPHPWLHPWPPHRRSGLANLFYLAVRQGASSPAEVLAVVMREVTRRLAQTTDAMQASWWAQVRTAIEDDRDGAKAYAAQVLAREQLPPAEKARLKQESAKAYVLAWMKGKPVTEKQKWMLARRGYDGPEPADRAQASDIIDRLLTGKGVA